MLDPPHSLHVLLMRWCWQMLAPPHSLHLFLSRWCGQRLAPPHSLHWPLGRWCWQMLDPPHSLHLLLWRLCGQTLRGFFCAAPPTDSASPSHRRMPAPLPAAADSAGGALFSPFSSASASLSLSVPSPNMLFESRTTRRALEMLGTHEARVAWAAPRGFVSCLSGARSRRRGPADDGSARCGRALPSLLRPKELLLWEQPRWGKQRGAS